MNKIDINQALAQMRAMAAEAQALGKPAEEPTQVDFAALLKDSIDHVNAAQKHADSMKEAFEIGDSQANLAQVMVASQKAKISFQAMVQVRNKLVEAYQEIMRMPI